jgi:streptomycin 6-kinase
VTLQPWLTLWNLTPDGEAFTTQFGSILLPVRQGGVAAMLKVPSSHEERRGGRLIAWYGADGAARVLAVDDRAVLLERAAGTRSLAVMARGGQDDAATAVLCETIARLHAERTAPPPAIPPLAEWFAALPPAAARFGGVLERSAAVAAELLAAPQDVRVLHGDVHHENVLDFGPRGWLAIDPKGLIGERGYDYANIVCNPDIETAMEARRFERRMEIICAAAGLAMGRQLKWVLAYAGLSASWTLEAGGDAGPALRVAQRAVEAIGFV